MLTSFFFYLHDKSSGRLVQIIFNALPMELGPSVITSYSHFILSQNIILTTKLQNSTYCNERVLQKLISLALPGKLLISCNSTAIFSFTCFIL